MVSKIVFLVYRPLLKLCQYPVKKRKLYKPVVTAIKKAEQKRDWFGSSLRRMMLPTTELRKQNEAFINTVCSSCEKNKPCPKYLLIRFELKQGGAECPLRILFLNIWCLALEFHNSISTYLYLVNKSVLEMNNPAPLFRRHPTLEPEPKPRLEIRHVVRKFALLGFFGIDPCSGSGTTVAFWLPEIMQQNILGCWADGHIIGIMIAWLAKVFSIQAFNLLSDIRKSGKVEKSVADISGHSKHT